MSILTFDAFNKYSGLIHGFSLRDSGGSIPASTVPAEVALEPLGYTAASLIQAEQPHGNHVSTVDRTHAGKTIAISDALITNSPDIILVIRTADCGALYFYDPVHHAIGLAHSGKKGTAANIAKNVIRQMEVNYGTDPAQIIAVLGPCIRPPHYEVNFPATISAQVKAAGVSRYYDSAEDTASDLNRFYSYRMEKGKTGRHYAFLGIQADEKE